jgi:xanthine dehydrogenase accessory factor
MMRGGPARLLKYDMRGDDGVLGLGMGCKGLVEVFVQPADSALSAGASERIRELLAGDLPFAVSTVIRSPTGAGRTAVQERNGRLTGSSGDPGLDREIATRSRQAIESGESALFETGGSLVFTEVLLPPPHLLIFGAGDDSRPLADLAGKAGFRLTLVDHRAASLAPDRFPAGTRLVHRRPEDGLSGLPVGSDCFVIMKLHSLAHDRAWLRVVLETSVGYIGVLGPRTRTTEMLEELGASDSDRIYAPVGLDLAAEGSEQVAVAIVAELLAVRAGRVPDHLRVRGGTIHAA